LAVLFCILGIYLILGAVLESLSMILLTVPIFYPIVEGLGFDLIWFGVVMLLALEMSGITPPFGLNLFVLLGVAPKETSMKDVALSGAPFLFCGLLLFLLMIFFPSIALFLPSLMGG